MGTTCSTGKADEEYKLNVMTLNYCGITSSPFEFYLTEYEPQLKRIGEFFKQLCEKQLDGYQTNSNLKKLFGNIEYEFKKDRYSPLFKIDAGIRRQIHENLNLNCFAEAEQQFRANWDHSYWQFINKPENGKLKAEWQREPNIQIYKRNVCKFDFLMLKALLKYVFREKTFEECTKKPIDIDRYNRIMKPFFEMSFLQEENKLSQFKYGFIKTQPDLFFIQECSGSLITFLNARTKKNYIFYHAKGQAIIFKRDKFVSQTDFKIIDIETILKKDEPEIQKLEDKTPRKILAVQSNNYLFLSLHLTSRPKENSLQKQYLRELFSELQRNLRYKDKIIIAGGDINSFENSLPPGYDFYPKKPEDVTTFKKRTPMQAQKNKIDDVIKRSIDKIITNKKISEGSITLIDGSKPAEYEQGEKERRQKKERGIGSNNQEEMKSNVKVLLPCDIHPFDQFLVKTTLTFTSELNANQQQSLRFKQKN